MSDPGRHDVAACARAWQTLRRAHDRVAARLGTALSRECAITINEFDVLLYLRTHPHEEVRISALLDAVPLSQPALSRLVARLESRGLLARSEVEHDARATSLCLTPSGSALIDHAIAIHAHTVHATLTGKLSDKDQIALLDLLNRIGG
jgi:DNA-binding MarR family transcriptional regulator